MQNTDADRHTHRQTQTVLYVYFIVAFVTIYNVTAISLIKVD